MVEKCHKETTVRPQEEPCRFCGKRLPTWKKLTVHLAKHMENMSLPVLHLVACQELEPDSIISPVQDPPPRSLPPAPAVKTECQPFNASPSASQSPMQPGVFPYPNTQQSSYTYQTRGTFPNSFYDPSLQHGLPQSSGVNLEVHQPGMSAGFQGQGGYVSPFTIPSVQLMTIPQQVEPFPAFINPLGLQDTSGNQIYDTGLDPVGTGGGQYTPQGSVSPYSRSPLQGQGGFYSHQ